jgi:type IV secretion system protein VirD4
MRSTGWGSAAWATAADVQRVGLTTGHGIVLCAMDGLVLRASRDLWAHTILFGPTRSGKGVSVLIPTLLSWPQSTIVMDLKGELAPLTAAYRRAQGQDVYRFDPLSLDGDAINPLDFVRYGTLREISDMQRLMNSLSQPEEQPTQVTEYWRAQSVETLVTCGLYLHYQDELPHTMGGLRRVMRHPSVPMPAMLSRMAACQHPALTPTVQAVIAEGVTSLQQLTPSRRQEVWGSAASLLSVWRDPLLDHNTRQTDIPFESFQDGARPVTLYMQVSPEDLQVRLRMVMRLLWGQIIWRLIDRPLTPPRWQVKLLIDEAGQLRHMEPILTMVSLAGGYGLGSLLVFQSPNQLTRWYGRANEILDNCGARIFYEPNDVYSAQWYEAYVGTATVPELSTRKAGDRWRLLYNQQIAESSSVHARPLLRADEFLALGEETCVMRVSGGCGPIRATKLRYHEDAVFQSLAG